ncbi:LysR substrate-binding domain-containing protein [Crossiella cryophila]|uniref:DNA-binding transcriptional LysR family regulator n=1 Tax=Crossiella cryophila TaxID=43355 RepID=A0A7W7CA35_9PSEU|nr:DNA-binding transcriptional LysR family regulator [Crossiella cryophila]
MQSDVDLKLLRYFLAVADEGTFTRASERLSMTQPALSRAIRTLEKAVGTPLFTRGPRGTTLTPAGLILSQDARTLVESVGAALTRAARFGPDRPPLRVTAPGCDVRILQALVESYNERYPSARPAHAAMVDRRVQADEVRAGEAEVTLLRFPADRRGLDAELLRSDPRVALVPESHPMAGRPVVQRTELAGEMFPVWPDLTPAETAFWMGTDLEDHPWRPGPAVQDGAQFVGSIRLGQAIGFIAAPHLPDVPRDGISVIPSVAGLSPSELWIAWAAKATSPDVARFVRHAGAIGERTTTSRGLA